MIRAAALAAVVVVGIACGGAQPDRAPPPTLSGVVIYELRPIGERGLSAAIERRPARFVRVELRDPKGRALAVTSTDEAGRFRFENSTAVERAARVVALAHVATADHDAAVTRDPDGRRPHEVGAPVADGVMLEATIASGTGGAFHVLDTMVRGLRAAQAWSGRELPPVFAWWAREGPQEGTVYREERPRGSGRYAIEILGGLPGALATSDTDEHDEGLVLHELGHLVMERLTFDSSAGGPHPRGARLRPGLAWEEGRATFFALAVLGSPRYVDTVGVEPHGELALDENAETLEDPLPGPGSEVGVIAVLWDLADGAGGLGDEDGDPVALGAAAVLRAMIAHAEEPGSYPSLESFLDHLLRAEQVERDAMRALLAQHARELEPVSWPRELELERPVEGLVDGRSQPAPSGGINVPATGYDATHTYRVQIDRAGRLHLALLIDGSVRADEATDLDLELRDRRSRLLGASRGEEAKETLSHPVEPGWYFVEVRDGGGGNRARYRLDARLSGS